MPFHIFALVIAAAFMHAAWNVMVKSNLDRFLSLALIQTLMGVMGVAMLLAFPFPARVSWIYALASGLLHTGYNLFLARAYRSGDLSQVYPIARGTAPLLTLVIAWLAANEVLSPFHFVGVAILVAGIWLTGVGGSKALRLDSTTLAYSLGTSLWIGLYTAVDGLGGRASGSPSGYAGLVFVLDSAMLFSTALALRGPALLGAVAPFWKMGAAGAALSGTAYWIIIWAMSQAPIAAVAALRESSILFVVLMSMRFLKERVSAWRLAGAALIVAGAVLLRFG